MKKDSQLYQLVKASTEEETQPQKYLDRSGKIFILVSVIIVAFFFWVAISKSWLALEIGKLLSGLAI